MWIIATFPGSLGEDVSKSVREELTAQSEENNRNIMLKILGEVFHGEKLIGTIATTRDLQSFGRN